MPSLRRTLSSPPVRRSPYSYPSSLSNGNLSRAGGHGPRRSSGSDVSHRRVLADIDWWIVQDGQRDELDASTDEPDARDESVHQDELIARMVSVAPAVSVIGDDAATIPPTWQLSTGTDADVVTESAMSTVPFFADVAIEGIHRGGSPETHSPLPEFADLAISPRTPLRRRYTTHNSETSFSSLQSTPESTHFALLPVPVSNVDMSFADFDTLLPSANTYPLALEGARRPAGSSSAMMRSVSYSFIESELSSTRHRDEERFSDVSAVPCPPPFFSLTRTDVDDLFY